MEDRFATRKEGAPVTREESADKEYFARGVEAIARSIVVDDDDEYGVPSDFAGGGFANCPLKQMENTK